MLILYEHSRARAAGKKKKFPFSRRLFNKLFLTLKNIIAASSHKETRKWAWLFKSLFFPPVVYSWLLCWVDDTRNRVGEKKSRCLPWLLCLLSCGERRRDFKVLIFRVSIKFFCWGEILSSSVSSHVYNFINTQQKNLSQMPAKFLCNWRRQRWLWCSRWK